METDNLPLQKPHKKAFSVAEKTEACEQIKRILTV